MCVIEGAMSVMMRPHLNREQAYAGTFKPSIYYDPSRPRKEQAGVSPVNFFMPDLTKFPLFDTSLKQRNIHLSKGDCLFIPAFYFYHMQGFRKMTASTKENTMFSAMFPEEYFEKNSTTMEQAKGEIYSTKLATAVSVRFKSNSKLLGDFYDAIHRNIIK